MSTQAEFGGELQQVNGGTKLAVRHWVATRSGFMETPTYPKNIHWRVVAAD